MLLMRRPSPRLVEPPRSHPPTSTADHCMIAFTITPTALPSTTAATTTTAGATTILMQMLLLPLRRRRRRRPPAPLLLLPGVAMPADHDVYGSCDFVATLQKQCILKGFVLFDAFVVRKSQAYEARSLWELFHTMLFDQPFLGVPV